MELQKLPTGECHPIYFRWQSDETLPTPQEWLKSGQDLKSKLRTSLHESAHQQLRRRPKNFHRFAELSDELQVWIIDLALGKGALISVKRSNSSQNLFKIG
jgi:hypothetical protein